MASIARSPLRHCWANSLLANTSLRILGPGLSVFVDHIVTLTSRPFTETTSSIGFCRCSAAASIIEKRHISEQFLPLSILVKASSDGTYSPPLFCVQFATSYSTMAPCGQCSSSSWYGGCMQTTQRFTATFMPFFRSTAMPLVHMRASRSLFWLRRGVRSTSTSSDTRLMVAAAIAVLNMRDAITSCFQTVWMCSPLSATMRSPTRMPIDSAWLPPATTSTLQPARTVELHTEKPSGFVRSKASFNVVVFGRLARSRACSTTCSADCAPPARAAAAAAAATSSGGGGAVGLGGLPPSAAPAAATAAAAATSSGGGGMLGAAGFSSYAEETLPVIPRSRPRPRAPPPRPRSRINRFAVVTPTMGSSKQVQQLLPRGIS